MSGHWVYVLLCSDGTLYTGYATDVRRRLEEHNSGRGAKYTRGRGPVSLVYTEECKSRSSALKRESQVKKLRRNEKLRLIANSRASVRQGLR